jgi:Ulp1 family protease
MHTPDMRQMGQYAPARELSWLEYSRLLFRENIFTAPLTPRQPTLDKRALVSTNPQPNPVSLSEQQRKQDEFKLSHTEESHLLEKVRREMEEKSPAPSVVIGEEQDSEDEDANSPMEVENDNSLKISARKEDISKDEISKIDSILRSKGNDLVIDKFNIDITTGKFHCLRPHTWLNDEIVNFYMCMLQERDQQLVQQSNGTRVASHYFNSFFYSKLTEGGRYNYGNVKRWSKKFDVFSLNKVFLPINLNNTHWVMAVVKITQHEIHYYDSMSGSGQRHLRHILQWLQDESKEKKKTELDTSSWQLIDGEEDVPQQGNGFDCGVFSIMCADYVSDDLPLCYNQSEMPNNRIKIGAAIARGQLTY